MFTKGPNLQLTGLSETYFVKIIKFEELQVFPRKRFSCINLNLAFVESIDIFFESYKLYMEQV